MFCVGLQKLIDEKNLSRKDISDVIGQSVSQVGMYIQGRRDPGTNVLLKLSKHYGVSVDSLLMNDYPHQKLYGLPETEAQVLDSFVKLPSDVQQDIMNLMKHIINGG